MTIDERLEALTQSVELLNLNSEAQQKRIDALAEMLKEIFAPMLLRHE